MKKKFVGIVFALVCILACALALTACNQTPAPSTPPAGHEHNWSKDWKQNETHHWHECTADDCDVTDNALKDGYGEHNFSNGDCVCGKVKPIIATDGLTYALNSDNESYSVTGIGTATDMEIVIASEYEGKPVTAIGDSAFSGCSSLTDITIPNNVTSIGSGAFSACSSLTSITIPNSVTSIGSGAFASIKEINISDLASWCNIDFEDSESNPLHNAGNLYINGELAMDIAIPDTVTEIKSYAFYGCNSLMSIELANSVTSIGTHAFRNCSNLTSVKINDNINYISDYSFGTGYNISYEEGKMECYTNITHAEIPTIASVAIANGSYNKWTRSSLRTLVITGGNELDFSLICPYCSPFSLESITIPDSVTSIKGTVATTKINYIGNIENWCKLGGIGNTSQYTLYINDIMLNELEMPDGMTAIPDYAFSGCNSLTSVTITGSVTSIGQYAFYNCSFLTNVIIPNSVTSIGQYAFYNCSSFTIVTIPDGVTGIEQCAFYNCASAVFYCEANNKPESWHSAWTDSEKERIIWDCNHNNKTVIVSGSYRHTYTYTVEEGIIYTSIFTEKEYLNPAQSPDGNKYYFYTSYVYVDRQPTSLNGDIHIKNGVRLIVMNAFENCRKITSIEIPNSVTSIGDAAFKMCSFMTITIPDSVTSIGTWAFYGCSGVIYCEVAYKPSGWKDDWNYTSCPVVWDCKNTNKDSNS